MKAKYRELRVAAVDAHAHNLVDIHSTFPFLRCFFVAEGDALTLAPNTLFVKLLLLLLPS
ncbi:hypothetical protein MUK42_30148 [Musa troglodytarum]|uniref:Uncharacterized protein n=1 Tax=Musa troglodytarum TaxID=320322 RepID=A0A9E7FZG2_9LILI|nr:hypothetical protein MUK42_30148 [Musa troglodytarum]